MQFMPLRDEDLPALAELFQQFWNETSSIEKMQMTFARLVKNQAYLLLGAKDADSNMFDTSRAWYTVYNVCE